MPNIQKASNLELIIELMFDGECRMVKSLVDEEPVNTRLICKLLASRTGRLPINKLEYWYEWFIDEATLEKTSNKNLLKKYFSYDTFQGCREEIIIRLLHDTQGHSLVIITTGAGKSFCYQIPAETP